MERPTFIDDYQHSDFFNGGSRLVYGCSGIGGVWGEVNKRESVDALLYAWEAGIEAIDTSPSYANSQRYIGQALKEWKGKRPFISTKIGRLESADAHTTVTDYSSEGLKKTLYSNLETLGVDKIDLLFLHEPHLVPIDEMPRILDILKGFQSEGLTDMLGVGGNPTPAFMPFITKDNFSVVSGFLHLDACNLTALDKQIPTYANENVAYYAASALHFSLLGNRFPIYSTQEPNEFISAQDQAAAKAIKLIADKNGMSIASLAQRYLFSIREADRVVMGARTPQQIASTVADWKKGKLSKVLFEEVTDAIIAARQSV